MTINDVKEYLVEGKTCVDVNGAADILGRAVGTIRNMTHMKNCPPYFKKAGKLYFEKEALEAFKKEREVIEVKKD